jgi:hypothetical protein
MQAEDSAEADAGTHARLTHRRLACVGWRFVVGILCGALCSLPAAAGSPDSPDSGAPAILAEAQRDQPVPMSEAGSPVPAGQHATPQDVAVAQPDSDRWRVPPPAQPDWQGARRDAGYFVGYQMAAVALLYVLPEDVSGLTPEQKHSSGFGQWHHNVSNPAWDDDTWFVNYVMHPYWGGAYYTRARERGLNRSQSFWYSALLSTLWEYGAEALAEPVSIQDLIVTPVFGALVGEYLFAPWRNRIRAKPGELEWSDKAVLVITDPLAAINEQIDSLFGVKTTLQFQSIARRTPAAGRDNLGTGHPVSPRLPPAGWKVQLRIEW